MPPALRRLLRFAPPVLGVAIVAYLILAATPRQERERAESSIRLRWESATEAPAVTAEVGAYLAAHGGEPAAVWFAVEAYAHLRDVARAVAVVTERPAIRDAKGTPRRLARILAETLSEERGKPGSPSMLSVRLLVARLDGDDEAARRTWDDDVVPKLDLPYLMAYYVPAYRSPSHGRAAIAAGFARRSEVREFRTAAALLRSGPAFRDDVPWLLEIFHSSWREERRPSWQNVTRALGATGDPRALAALRAAHEKAVSNGDTQTRDPIDVALAISGDAEARERVFALTGTGSAWLTALYAVGLAQRLAQGDEGAIPRLVELWDRDDRLEVRLHLAEGVLLADPAPPPNPAWDRWADALVASPVLLPRSAGHAARFRTGRDTAFEGLAGDLVDAAKRVDLGGTPNPDDVDASAAIEVLRAWLRWGG